MIIVTSCKFENVNGTDLKPGPEPNPSQPADTVGIVQPDGILETVTWNLKWYGSDSNGPSDEDLQTSNTLQIIDSLEADLFAMQEISSQQALNNLTSRMKGYRGFVANHIGYDQKTAFVFNTQTIDSVSSGPIEEFQDEDDWAGRLPFYFAFNYTYGEQDISVPVYAIVVHGKCCSDKESYQRRMRAAESLYTYLTRNKPNANIIFLGDYNDDVDESIYQEARTPYASFVNDENNFSVVTQALSKNGQSSTISYPETIDHITISNEMTPYYQMNSVRALTKVTSFIEAYGSTTTDHYPVMAAFDMRN